MHIKYKDFDNFIDTNKLNPEYKKGAFQTAYEVDYKFEKYKL